MYRSEPSAPPAPADLATHLADHCTDYSLADFRWDQQFTRHIRESVAFVNDQGYVPPSHKHTPSRLCTCPRKAYYDLENAPAEDPPPEGLYWTGTRIEEDLVIPWLAEVAPENVYVQAEAYPSFEVTTGGRHLEFSCVTDPLLVDADGTPLLPTEIKSVRDLDAIEAPNPQHRAQLLAYLYGFRAAEDQPDDVRQGLLVYISQATLETRVFVVELTVETWSPVLEWARDLTEYRVERSLPPADPPDPDMCEHCPYRRRCGQTDHDVADAPIQGLVPGHVYPRERLEAYLAAHDDAQLTPTCAQAYPDLASDHPVAPWRCRDCGAEVPWDGIDVANADAKGDQPPVCPRCGNGRLIGPDPSRHDNDPTTGRR